MLRFSLLIWFFWPFNALFRSLNWIASSHLLWFTLSWTFCLVIFSDSNWTCNGESTCANIFSLPYLILLLCAWRILRFIGHLSRIWYLNSLDISCGLTIWNRRFKIVRRIILRTLNCIIVSLKVIWNERLSWSNLGDWTINFTKFRLGKFILLFCFKSKGSNLILCS